MAVSANSTPAPSRRSLVAGLAVLPLAAAPAISAPSNLAIACDQAIAHVTWIDAAAYPGRWPDERLDAEMDKHSAVFWRAIEEPSASLRDVVAKARLVLEDFDRHSPDDSTRDTQERLLAVVLKEIIAFAPVS